MHRWPAGRIIRLIVLGLAVLITVDLAYHAWAALTATTAPAAAIATPAGQPGPLVGGSTTALVVGILYAVLAVAVLVAGLAVAGFHRRCVDFLIEVQDEMTRVEWPNWPTVWRTTLVVAAMMLVLSLITFGVDFGCRKFVDLISAIGKGSL